MSCEGDSPSVCRSITRLFNLEPPAADDEIRAAALQFVRKITGYRRPSKANEAAFAAAVEEISMVASRLLASLETSAPPRSRDGKAAGAKARAARHFSG